MEDLGDEIDAQARESNVSTEAQTRKRIVSRRNQLKLIESDLNREPISSDDDGEEGDDEGNDEDGDENGEPGQRPRDRCPWPKCNYWGNPQRIKYVSDARWQVDQLLTV